LESFKPLTESEEQKKIIDSYYKAGDERSSKRPLKEARMSLSVNLGNSV
jgi:hypothetical protein